MLFRIARSREGGEITHYDVYKVEVSEGMTVLDALFQIQDRMDPSLAFRYGCRGAVCGSCGMLVNKMPVLACGTQVDEIRDLSMNLQDFPPLTDTPAGWDPERSVLIEPLPNFPILKDLVVDLSKFYDVLEQLKLWAEPQPGNEARSHSPEDRKRIERYVHCIMCAICFGACPVNHEKEEYVGPAALAKAWRFYDDARLTQRRRYLEAAKQADGAPLCELIMNCVRACPKGVAPGGAIRKIKNESIE